MRNTLIFLFVVSAIGCGQGGAYQKKIHANYWVTALDSMDELALMNDSSGYMVNIVEPKVVEYQSGTHCIAVKRELLEIGAFEYYIVPLGSLQISTNEEKNLLGPFQKGGFIEEFQSLCKEPVRMKPIE